ncbi:MAG: hypothetical protein JSS41_11085 [Proteobacteria bacterium]|nr:hypothetical protein [Pseudomonadota bacterium]
MRLSWIVPVAVLCLCALVLAAAWRGRAQVSSPAHHTGMDLLRAYPCRRSETKVVQVKGIEDGFSPAGNELGFLRPGLDKARWRSIGAGRYDQSQPDREFHDSLQIPAHIHDGLFVIGLKALPVSDSGNDILALGDLTSPNRFSHLIADLPGLGWNVDGVLHSAALGNVILNAPGQTDRRSLLDWLREGAQTHWLDVMVEDDTSVDFIGLAACVEPPRGKGVTLMTSEAQPAAGIVALSCRNGPPDWPICDPYTGDTPCESELPVACLLPGREPPPRELAHTVIASGWTGGRIAFTGPVAAAKFRAIQDVDAYCATHFGKAWRTLTAHDGNPAAGAYGRGRPPPVPVRAWVDEVNQPYATCWTR